MGQGFWPRFAVGSALPRQRCGISNSAGRNDAHDGRPRTGQATRAFASWRHATTSSPRPSSRYPRACGATVAFRDNSGCGQLFVSKRGTNVTAWQGHRPGFSSLARRRLNVSPTGEKPAKHHACANRHACAKHLPARNILPAREPMPAMGWLMRAHQRDRGPT